MTPNEIVELGKKIDAGIKASVAAALEEHRLLGRKVVFWRDGQIVHELPPAPASLTEKRDHPEAASQG